MFSLSGLLGEDSTKKIFARLVSVRSAHTQRRKDFFSVIRTGDIPLQHTSPDDKDALYQELIDFLMHPEFQKVLAEIRSLPPDEGLQAALKQLSPKELATMSIPIPEDLRITTSASWHTGEPLPEVQATVCIGPPPCPPRPGTVNLLCICTTFKINLPSDRNL